MTKIISDILSNRVIDKGISKPFAELSDTEIGSTMLLLQSTLTQANLVGVQYRGGRGIWAFTFCDNVYAVLSTYRRKSHYDGRVCSAKADFVPNPQLLKDANTDVISHILDDVVNQWVDDVPPQIRPTVSLPMALIVDHPDIFKLSQTVSDMPCNYSDICGTIDERQIYPVAEQDVVGVLADRYLDQRPSRRVSTLYNDVGA